MQPEKKSSDLDLSEERLPMPEFGNNDTFNDHDKVVSPHHDDPINQRIRKVAIQFHAEYEDLAPAFGYETRKDTRVFDPRSRNGMLMIATIKALLDTGVIQIPE